MSDPTIEHLLARYIEAHEESGATLDLADLCRDVPDRLPELRDLVDRYLRVSRVLDRAGADPPRDGVPAAPDLPSFPGFRTIERIGGGGMGDVYKLQDLTLDRIVAGKVLRPDARLTAQFASALGEARSMAALGDRRIVQVFEYRTDADPPVIIMEHVDGFELGRLGRSLEYRQRARIVAEVCEALDRVHAVGIQHRDLKPSNILLDAELTPKILDFGLSAGDPTQGHFVGTLPYLAPEQVDASRPIDARTDIYAVGVVLYELLCGRTPYDAADAHEVLAAIRAGRPPLPVEIEPGVPEPLQAIALQAVESDPARRYQSAREMALDLRRYLDGRPVLARPSQYVSVLQARVRPHLDHIHEWVRLHLIYPHEAARLTAAYGDLEGRDDDWIVAGRVLSYSQIALYLGAFLLMAGSLFYFGAYQVHKAVTGLLGPFLVLAVPFIGLNSAAFWLERRDHRAVSVAFYLAGVVLLPLFLLILLHEMRWWEVAPNTAGQFFADGVSNRQLQITIVVACAWAAVLALHTRTAALSTVFVVLMLAAWLAGLTDLGLRRLVEEGRWDLIALRTAPLAPLYFGVGAAGGAGRGWLARPAFMGAVITLLATLELLALDGRAFGYLGFSIQSMQAGRVSDPTLLDTLAAMTVNGAVFYGVGLALERWGTREMRPAAYLLFAISPFAMLAPLGYLCRTGEYSLTFDWWYLGLALGIALISHQRQRKSFYYAGLLNTAVALVLIADHRHWFDRPAWATAVIAAGLVALLGGFALAVRERLSRGVRT